MPKNKKSKVVSLSGAPIYHHTRFANREPMWVEAYRERISSHIEEHLGPIAVGIDDLISRFANIITYIIQPNEEYPFVRLVTSGMSQLPLAVPEELDAPHFVELMITLPQNWRMDSDVRNNERWIWPLHLISFLARFPHKVGSWLGIGHTIAHGNPPKPYSENAGFCCALLLPPLTVASAFCRLKVNDDKVIDFLSVVPIYKEEMYFKLYRGVVELVDRLNNRDISDLIDIHRTNVCADTKTHLEAVQSQRDRANNTSDPYRLIQFSWPFAKDALRRHAHHMVPVHHEVAHQWNIHERHGANGHR